jgi:NADH-quinone oxidoreductase subunit C
MFLLNKKNKFLRSLLKLNNYNLYKNHYNFIYALLVLLNSHLINVKLTNGEIVLVLKNANNLLFIFNVLNKHYKFQFKELVDICTVDYYVFDNNNRFEINYLLLSVKYKIRLRIKLYTKNNMLLSSINSIYSSAL